MSSNYAKVWLFWVIVHADAVFLNESKAHSRAGAHIFLSENNPNPKLNDPVLTIAQIIKSVMASAAEAEMAALYIIANNYNIRTYILSPNIS